MAKKNYMKKLIIITCLLLITITIYSYSSLPEEQNGSVYNVVMAKKPVKIDANWDKPVWKKVKAVRISNYMGSLPEFKPEAEVR